jgi:hypothetical protein
MKKFILLSFVLVLMAISCAKTDNAVFAPAIPTIDPTLEYSTWVIGTWQLSEIGVLTKDPVNSSSNQGGCGSGESHSDSYTWTSPTENEKLTFNADGTFLQDKISDASCRGAYQLKGSYLSIKSDCSQVEPNLTITAMNKVQLIVEKTGNDHSVLLKYVHL